MSNNYIYSGVTTPYWNQIDYIHFGPAYNTCEYGGTTYPALDPNGDNILLGRYVLVKYTTSIFSQDQKYELRNGIGEANTFANAELWKECYEADGGAEEDYDGVVFQKVFKDNKMQYISIAQLSTSVSQEGFNTQFLTNKQAEANYLKKADAKDIYLKQDDQLVKDIKYFLEYETEDTTEIVDTLVDIQKLINDTANGNTPVGTLITQVSTQASDIDILKSQVSNNTTAIESISKQVCIPIESIEEFKDTIEWPMPNNDNLLVNQLYSKTVSQFEIRTQWKPNDINNKFIFNLKDLKIDTYLSGGDIQNMYIDWIRITEFDYDTGEKIFNTNYVQFNTSQEDTMPISFYRVEDGNYQYYGLLYLIVDQENNSYSPHFTLATYNYIDTGNYLDGLDQYEGKYSQSDGTLLSQHPFLFDENNSNQTSPVSIEDIIKNFGLTDPVVSIATVLPNYQKLQNYILLTGEEVIKTNEYDFKELRYIVDNNGKEEWVNVGYVTDLPQWQTF